MANSKKPYNKKKIQDTDNSNFGNYNEDVGGGASPQAQQPGTHGHGVNSDHRKEHNDTMQPRTDDGKFTYKSVNGQKINPKYGPSRGETVNPLLTGGKNGIKISDVEEQFYNEKGEYWDKYKDKWYRKGGEIVTSDVKVRVAGEAIWEVGKRSYDKVKGEFEGESHIFDETKKGRPGEAEKTAKKVAEQTGQEKYVIDSKTGAIKLKPGTVLPPPNIPPAGGGGSQPTVPPNIPPSGTVQQPTAGTQPSAPGGSAVAPSLKHTSSQIQAFRDLLKSSGKDDSAYTDEQLDAIYDDFIEEDDDDNNTNNSNNSNSSDNSNNNASKKEDDKEEDSDTIKKIKSMGFDGEDK